MFYVGYNPNEHKVQMVQTDLNLYSLFLYVFPKVVNQIVSTVYDVFVIKYMKMWNSATLVESITPVSPSYSNHSRKPIILYLQFFS